jgi:hypothetical protein
MSSQETLEQFGCCWDGLEDPQATMPPCAWGSEQRLMLAQAATVIE